LKYNAALMRKIQDVYELPGIPWTPDRVIEAVHRLTGITHEMMLMQTRDNHICFARMMAQYYIYKLTPLSLNGVDLLFPRRYALNDRGDYSHCRVLHSVKTIDLMRTDKARAEVIKRADQVMRPFFIDREKPGFKPYKRLPVDDRGNLLVNW
jgi:chromosomal replication initiation ATPase DnaA